LGPIKQDLVLDLITTHAYLGLGRDYEVRLLSLRGLSELANDEVALRARWATRARHISFLEGKHATAGLEPPTDWRSTTATFLPDCQASCLPPWPLPRMTTSKVSD
jgi:hypothetical protein